MQKCLFSRHIPKSKTDSRTITEDIVLFNTAVRQAYAWDRKDRDALSSRKAEGLPDRRLKENRGLIESGPPSVHMRLKRAFGMNDYFANSANQTAKGILRSVKELRSDAIKEKGRVLSDVRKKLSRTKKRLADLEKTKQCCIELSRWEKHRTGKRPDFRMPSGGKERLDKKTGIFSICRFLMREGRWIVEREFPSRYIFEVQYLDPEIKRLRHRVRSLQGRTSSLEAAVIRLEREPSVCFGGKNFFRKQDTVYASDHEAWKRRFSKKRNAGMTISGRRDSKDGNYVFRYDPVSHVLIYASIGGKKVVIPGVVFPYGQELLEAYLTRQRTDRSAPIAWRIEDHGGSWIVKCTLTLTDSRQNSFYGDGCIGMDTNIGCLALSETDGMGNLLWHRIVPFDLTGLSSERSEHVLSNVLEEVFELCRRRNKPLAMEKLEAVARGSVRTYGRNSLNRALSSFAHRKITQLAISKGYKYGIAVVQVNPAFTSQIGKVKYMGRYGLSVHEAAALAVARRAMGFRERIPSRYRDVLPPDKVKRHHWSHWGALHKEFRELKPSDMYMEQHALRASSFRHRKKVQDAS